jgi:catechol 2,3-dioxygenase-like lactoylglutathione lyase family enzyme
MTHSLAFPVRFHYISLSVADLAGQQRWYQQTLGFTEVIEQFEIPDPPVRTAVLQTADGPASSSSSGRVPRATTSSGIRWTPCAASAAGTGREVDHLDETHSRLVQAGAGPVWPHADAVATEARFADVADAERQLDRTHPATGGELCGRGGGGCVPGRLSFVGDEFVGVLPDPDPQAFGIVADRALLFLTQLA